MKIFKIHVFLILVFITFFECSSKSSRTVCKVISPDGNTKIVFRLNNGLPIYKVSHSGKPVILPSLLGFTFKSEKPLIRNFTLLDSATTAFDEIWQPVWGTSEIVHNRYNQLIVKLQEKSAGARQLNIIFRVFDDGIAFRYEFPRQPNLGRFEITSEETRFKLANNHSCWWIPQNYDSYEQLYSNTPLSEIEAVNTPITMETVDSLYISIHEANLTDYAGMTLKKVADEPYTLECDLVPWPDSVKVKAITPFITPWRTIQIADTPGKLIESHIIENLNEPCKIEDTSWIRPMKYMGIWWGMHIGKYSWSAGANHGTTTENAKRHIDFASENNIQGLLIEGWNTGWENWGKDGAFNFTESYPDFDLAEVVKYGKTKGVEIIGHHETGGDVLTYESQIDGAFALYHKLGMPGVKTGYAGHIRPEGQHHHGQWMVRHYREVVKKAVGYHLIIDAHEPVKPTGIRRTYPNMMTREGVRGLEFNAWSEGNPPEHTTILPFTRMLAGPLDYTPGIFDLHFDEYKKENRVHTTLAKQLALYVVLHSPMQMVADLPENYKGQPAFRFINDVPVDWDETIVLNGEIGDFVTIARRSGDDWYIGSITDENERLLNIQLDFLKPDQRYAARIYADGEQAHWDTNPYPLKVSTKVVDFKDNLTIKLAPGGGQAIRIFSEMN